MKIIGRGVYSADEAKMLVAVSGDPATTGIGVVFDSDGNTSPETQLQKLIDERAWFAEQDSSEGTQVGVGYTPLPGPVLVDYPVTPLGPILAAKDGIYLVRTTDGVLGPRVVAVNAKSGDIGPEDLIERIMMHEAYWGAPDTDMNGLLAAVPALASYRPLPGRRNDS